MALQQEEKEVLRNQFVTIRREHAELDALLNFYASEKDDEILEYAWVNHLESAANYLKSLYEFIASRGQEISDPDYQLAIKKINSAVSGKSLISTLGKGKPNYKSKLKDVRESRNRMENYMNKIIFAANLEMPTYQSLVEEIAREREEKLKLTSHEEPLIDKDEQVNFETELTEEETLKPGVTIKVTPRAVLDRLRLVKKDIDHPWSELRDSLNRALVSYAPLKGYVKVNLGDDELADELLTYFGQLQKYRDVYGGFLKEDSLLPKEMQEQVSQTVNTIISLVESRLENEEQFSD